MKPVDHHANDPSIDPVLIAIQRYTMPAAIVSFLVALAIIGCALIF